MYRRLWTWLVLAFLGVLSGQAQMVESAISWRTSIEESGEMERTLRFEAIISPGWHLYATDLPEGGPQPTVVIVDELVGGELVGTLTADKKATEKYDNLFSMKIGYYSSKVSFRQVVRVTDPSAFKFVGALRYMVCDDAQCLPPTNEEFSYNAASFGIASGAKASKEPATISNESEREGGVEATLTAQAGGDKSSSVDALWTPVIDELKALGDNSQREANSSSWMIFVYGFLGGLVALMTPCVWPMIPMTMSFFLKRGKSRGQSIRDAMTYGLSIVVIYVALGLSVSAIFGASALNDLSTSALFNVIFFALLVTFSASFFGAFELVLPASWTNKMDQKADSTTGVLSILFMAFTLSLVSFSCTGPIIGTLLVQAASDGSLMGPAIGMLGFSIALALPFALFALFPGWLNSMPKSGGWLNSVKVVLGFLELALALKFLSVADLTNGWGILDREVFVSLWIVIFFLLGLYLLGKIRFPHDSPSESASILGLFLGIASLSFAVYMLPGLWGAPLRAISAFAPPLKTQDFNLYQGEVHAQFTDYEAGMSYARSVGKPVLIDFSGYGCVNCRKMEASVWVDPEVKSILEEDYVLITLMVDDKTPLPSIQTVVENSKEVKLRTIGDKWSYFQRSKFGANAQPFYVGLDHEGKPLTPSRGYDEDIPAYVDFLKGGLERFAKEK